MGKSKLLHIALLLVGLTGALIATAFLLTKCNPSTKAPSAAPKVDIADKAQSVGDAGSLASYTVEGQEIGRGYSPYIIRRISVDKSVTEQELRSLLLHELQEIRRLDYGPMPERRCAFTVLAYCEPANARNFSGPRLATIVLRRGESQPNLSIAKEALTVIKETPKLKFGLDDDTRKKIYWDLVQANYQCSDQCDQEFSEMRPRYGDADNSKWILKRSARFDKLWEQQQDRIARKYGLSRQQTTEINLEGMRKHWPEPVDPLSKRSDRRQR